MRKLAARPNTPSENLEVRIGVADQCPGFLRTGLNISRVVHARAIANFETLAAFQMPLPAPYDACEKVATTVSSLSLVRYRLNDYSVPTIYGHRDVLVRGYVHEVVISCGAEVIARHPRSYEREDFVFEPMHYLA